MRDSFLTGIMFSSFVIAIVVAFYHQDLFLAICFALIGFTAYVNKTNY